MNTRVLVIDDSPKAKHDTCDKLEEELRKNDFSNPEAVWLNTHEFPQNDQLLAEVERLASSNRWDALLVDINLGRTEVDMVALLLPFQIVEAFRQINRVAIVFIFSGTMEDHLRKIFTLLAPAAAKKEKNEVERHFRNLWHVQIKGFFRRDNIVENVVGELRHPPWMLQLEREALKIGEVPIDWITLSQGLENSSAQLVNFKELSDGLRRGDAVSKSIANHVMSYGIAAVAEIYKLSELRQTRVPFVTAECPDLEFVDEVKETLKEQMPGLDLTRLQFHQKPSDQLSWLPAAPAPAVIFMLHGGDGYLKGADPNAASMAPDGLRWMDCETDRKLIAGKAVYCFSCNSKTLAIDAVESGVIAFIGFPDIPFYRFDDGAPRNEPELTESLQHLYVRLTETVLLRWFMGKDTIEQIVEFVKLTVRGLTKTFVETNPQHPYRNDVVLMFEKIALGVMFEGNGEWVFPGN
jgi:CheY-like chemotaxis protein